MKARRSPLTYEILMREILSRIDETSSEIGCWLYTGANSGNGYGRYSRNYVHREMYEAMVGPIPEGYQIDHLCRVRRCCNPAHLEAVTQRENILRGSGLGAIASREQRCIRGHDLSNPTVVRERPDGGRYCIPCANYRASKAYKAERVAS